MTGLPATADEQRMIAWASELVARVKHKLTSSSADEFPFYVASLADYLRRHDDFETMKEAIVAAEAGNPIAHYALDRVFREQLDAGVMPGAALRDYHRRAEGVTRGSGHFRFEECSRNIGLMIIVRLTCEAFGLSPTRSRQTRRARRPCGCSIIDAALELNGIDGPGEGRLSNLWFSLGKITVLMIDDWRRGLVHE
jgi:hypothetical protein